uniref:NADH-ubiquinone oxidoreductase chain 5 n=1 Tax=Ramulus mikado TaxID=2823491 RepID=E2RUV1_9NEOP|nr:NADH dehydrogenase subunit 5 [Ramulus irregulariterdentatus]BAJ24485.1 NADH dehydrogenase subunit 5 [Ramulus irregulariterdentatus]
MLFYYSLCSILFVYFFFISLILILIGVYFISFDLVIFVEYELFMYNGSQFIMTLLFDWMSLIFMGFVLFISSLIIYYSKGYMSGDKYIDRFIILVLMFVFSMMFMIISPNLISILLGWDGLGLVSYCLVIYYQNIKSYNAGMITALSNRVGDSMLLMSIAWLFNYGSWNYFMYIDFYSLDFNSQLISLFIIIAAMTKSAQIPFSPWLPAAMAAPTPVSSLVHSSTLVTAGIYLLIRFNPLYVNSFLMNYLLFISLITMFMSGLGANFEFDLKSIIALSTLSQLGLMMSILSFGYIYMAYFHLLTHALFKALLFMCSGVVIHSFKDCQDIRCLGNLFNQMPLTCICFIIASLCLCGMPFLSGFYSKDLILEMYSSGYINYCFYIIYYLSTGLTVSYSVRLLYYLIISDFSFYTFHSVSDESWLLLKSMFTLMFVSIFGGCMLSWVLLPTPYLILLPFWMKLSVIIVCFMGGWLGYFFNSFNLFDFIYSYLYSWLITFFGSMWFMPFIITNLSYYSLFYGLKYQKSGDYGWFEMVGGQGLYYLLMKMSLFNQKVQNSLFNLFFIIMSFWFIILMFM